MIKVILIFIIVVFSIAAGRYAPVTVINAPPKTIARCLADTLSPYNYVLDIQGTDIAGINKAFTVYDRYGKNIAGTFGSQTQSQMRQSEPSECMVSVNKRTLFLINRCNNVRPRYPQGELASKLSNTIRSIYFDSSASHEPALFFTLFVYH